MLVFFLIWEGSVWDGFGHQKEFEIGRSMDIRGIDHLTGGVIGFVGGVPQK